VIILLILQGNRRYKQPESEMRGVADTHGATDRLRKRDTETKAGADGAASLGLATPTLAVRLVNVAPLVNAGPVT